MREEPPAFEWDEGNEAELARHHITAEEIEQVFDNAPIWASNKRNRAGNRLMVGRTDGGRWLTVVVRVIPEHGMIRAITGWDSTQGERTRYGR